MVRFTPLLVHDGFNTQPPEGGWTRVGIVIQKDMVSTHSRPKAAGMYAKSMPFTMHCFNTQPPEGGWNGNKHRLIKMICFNTQPPEGGWAYQSGKAVREEKVSTHSRPKAAGSQITGAASSYARFQHTAARRRLVCHNTPKNKSRLFQHTAARRRLGRRHI